MCLLQLELAAGGIKVNSQLQTSNPDVYAVGDVAAFPLQATGGDHARQEHIVNARMTAKHAVNAILGKLTTAACIVDPPPPSAPAAGLILRGKHMSHVVVTPTETHPVFV